MNISRGRTEAAVAYKARQDALDKHIRIASVAHTLLGKLVDGPRGDLVLGALYGAMASRTKPVHRVPSSAEAVRESARRSVALSIAAVHSDFEWACRDLLTDVLEFWEPRWTPQIGNVQAPRLVGRSGRAVPPTLIETRQVKWTHVTTDIVFVQSGPPDGRCAITYRARTTVANIRW